MKQKIKFIIVGFFVITIPLLIVGKRFIAIDIQRQALEICSPSDNNPDFEKATKKIDLAIKLAPKNYLFYMTKAEFLERQNRFKDANKLIREIFEFKPDYAEGFVAIAMNYEKLNLPDSAHVEYGYAIKTYDKRIEKYKNDKERLFSERVNKAAILRQAGNVLKAEVEFKELKNEYPNKVDLIESIEKLDINIMEQNK